METQKPGWHTSELWLTTAKQLLSFALAFGVLSPQDAETLGQALARGIPAAFIVVAAAWEVVTYIRGRVITKTTPADPTLGAAALRELQQLRQQSVRQTTGQMRLP